MKYFYYYPTEQKLIPRTDNIEKGVLVLLGENRKENDSLVKECDGEDVWFHVADFPSGHAIYTGDNISMDAIKKVAELVKGQSKLKNEKNVSINYINLKNVVSTKNPGQVMLTKKPNIIKV